MMTQLREAEARCSDQARRRERAEREAAEFKETSRKLRQSLEEAEKESRGLRWELEDRKKLAAAEVSCCLRARLHSILLGYMCSSMLWHGRTFAAPEAVLSFIRYGSGRQPGVFVVYIDNTGLV